MNKVLKSALGLAFLFLSFSYRGGETRPETVSCGPLNYGFRASVMTLKGGSWSDPQIWSTGKVPALTDAVTISDWHTVVADINSTVAGIDIKGSLWFDNTKNITLQSSENIYVTGNLQVHPQSNVNHVIRMISVNEAAFVGGGESPVVTDKGIWVMGNGQLFIGGVQKSSWTNALSSVAAGNTTISVKDAFNWQAGDELAITPTAKGAKDFSETSIKSVTGSSITLNKAVGFSHPLVYGKFTAEVMNLTRNVKIEGLPNGRSHIFIRSNRPSIIKNVAFRYLGPRKQIAGTSEKEFVLGRYGLHFHHCYDASGGSVVENCVMRDVDNHSYVIHGSHGVTVKGSIAYNVTEDAFWWDEGPTDGNPSHRVKFIGNIAAKVKFVPGSIKTDDKDGSKTLSSRGFLLNYGDDDSCIGNVAVGCEGDEHDGAGFKWEAANNSFSEGIWAFFKNIAHNNQCGLQTWQNVDGNHIVDDFVVYNNKENIFHGAYGNAYHYTNFESYGAPIIIHAVSVNTARVKFENGIIVNPGDYGIVIQGGAPDPGLVPVLIRNVKVTGAVKAAFYDQSPSVRYSADIIQCEGNTVLSAGANSQEVLRIQPVNGGATMITRAGTSTIPDFAPRLWGNGQGLYGEYFNNTNFTEPAFSRVDSYIGFSWWGNGVHNAIKGNTYSVRWSGKIQPQFSETYTFKISSAGVHRLKINGTIVINNTNNGTIALEAGKLYDIIIEFQKSSLRGGIEFFWNCNSLDKFTKGGEIVPRWQLYPAGGQPLPNQLPVVNAGPDKTITLPVSSVTLNGIASDPDGVISTYRWQLISGPAVGTGTILTMADLVLNSLKQGTYTFQLQVTDDRGGVSQDNVVVTVLPSAIPVNQVPVSNAGTDIAITLPVNSVVLSGSGIDADGSIVSYRWDKVSGPAQFTIANQNAASTAVNNLLEGIYVFSLLVTDNAGASAFDNVTVVVKPVPNQAPVADAGQDGNITIGLLLEGKGTDADGTIVSYKWEKQSGPACTIISESSQFTKVINLQAGTYVFKLTVTDNRGAVATATVTKVVNN